MGGARCWRGPGSRQQWLAKGGRQRSWVPGWVRTSHADADWALAETVAAKHATMSAAMNRMPCFMAFTAILPRRAARTSRRRSVAIPLRVQFASGRLSVQGTSDRPRFRASAAPLQELVDGHPGLLSAGGEVGAVDYGDGTDAVDFHEPVIAVGTAVDRYVFHPSGTRSALNRSEVPRASQAVHHVKA